MISQPKIKNVCRPLNETNSHFPTPHKSGSEKKEEKVGEGEKRYKHLYPF